MQKDQSLSDPSGRIYFRWQDHFHEAIGTVILLMVVFFMFCGVFWLSSHYAKPIEGSSMQPLINNYDVPTGDIAIVSAVLKYTYDDIVIVDMERTDTLDMSVREKLLIKRVVALPGDSLKLENLGGYYYFYLKKSGENDFQQLNNPNVQPMTSSSKAAAFYSQSGWTHKITPNDDGSITIPENMLFFMGDNRNDSYDCRNFGPVCMVGVTGVVESILPKDSFWNQVFGLLNFFNRRPTSAP